MARTTMRAVPGSDNQSSKCARSFKVRFTTETIFLEGVLLKIHYKRNQLHTSCDEQGIRTVGATSHGRNCSPQANPQVPHSVGANV